MSRINEVLIEGYRFEMGTYMGEGWNYFKKGAGSFIGFTLIYLFISLIISFIPFVNVLSTAVQLTLTAGIFVYTRNLSKNRAEFGDLFEGFNQFGQIFLFFLVLIGLMIPVIVLFVVALVPEGFLSALMSGTNDPSYIIEELAYMFEGNVLMIASLYGIFLLYITYIYISYSLTLPLIVDRKLRFWQAMETSRKVVAKNFFSFLGMYILLFLMFGIGVVFTCGLGIFVAIPFMNTVVFSAYDNILGEESNDMEQQIAEFGNNAESNLETE